ncbi:MULTISPECIES: PLP-dependent aminotransferase family protein [unclassified Staphylococcus]|uniref:MocR-like pyridoxine biosynthesis transcription factor PdxR n=1 Tax=unclassified Staphylococcus TaxID=91994 RepID=UPI0021D1E0F1|nr:MULTISPECIES: PLP-dependent aminotransferase family protein [unclassified Staphylococcus]UXR71823.1 PLP-dependent aminotransferase family protein [Staphylococcus sp. IVB6240]UXR76520.1 PLP-dependent aminotransferase family protein [Staphylococcus sp. IVB6233]UXR80647.1 PLP-dependent aminotransferase family protein [Staphylococcus sp. IVB6218]
MEMLMFHIDKSQNQPIYMQLYENIRSSIINGQLQEDEKLPSKRLLGDYLSISQTTIENAYAQLIDEGYIYSKQRSGYFVSDIDTLPLTTSQNDIESKTISMPKTSSQSRYNFQLGAIDKAHFPFKQFRKFAKEAFDTLQDNLVESGNPQGEFALRQQISHYLFHSRGVQSTPEQVIIASSTEQLLSIITDLLPEQHAFMLEDPIYPQVPQLLNRKHIPYSFIPVQTDGIQMRDIEQCQNNIIYITPSHQFPTGVTMSLQNRIKLLKWANQHPNRYIIEDDYDSEFRYEGKPIPALQSLDNGERVIYVSTFSKSIAPSIRIAYAVLPIHLATQYQRTENIEGGTVPRHTQYIVSQFMESNQFERHLNRMRRIYRQKRDILINYLTQFPSLIEIDGAQTGMHFVITIKNGLSEQECLQRFKSYDINLQPLSDYHCQYQENTPRFVLGFGGIEDDDLQYHAERLIHALQ